MIVVVVFPDLWPTFCVALVRTHREGSNAVLNGRGFLCPQHTGHEQCHVCEKRVICSTRECFQSCAQCRGPTCFDFRYQSSEHDGLKNLLVSNELLFPSGRIYTSLPALEYLCRGANPERFFPYPPAAAPYREGSGHTFQYLNIWTKAETTSSTFSRFETQRLGLPPTRNQSLYFFHHGDEILGTGPTSQLWTDLCKCCTS